MVRGRGTSRSAAFVALVVLAACSHNPAPAPTAPAPSRFVQTGVASWYGPGFQGKPTASGETYNQEALTAAHRTLPLGTRVRVTNMDNDRTVDVRINDRGPFVGDRIIDLSHAAAVALDMIGPGTAHVRLEVLDTPAPIESVAAPLQFTVQVASYADRASAEALRETLMRKFKDVRVAVASTADGTRYRVQVGAFTERAKADDEARRVARAGYSPLVVER